MDAFINYWKKNSGKKNSKDLIPQEYFTFP